MNRNNLVSLSLAASTIAALFFASADVRSQQHSEHANEPVHAEVSVAADRIAIGPEYLPRRTDLPNTLIVPAGKILDLSPESTYDYIEVAGTLRASRTHDTVTRFTQLVVLPGGTLDVGTQADPIPCDRHVELVIRDVPLDTTKDPFQWGNGLVNFGRQTRVGCSKTAWLESSGGIASGATTIALATAPSGWHVGDELLLPDTATPSVSTFLPRRESKVTIAAIEGTQLTLSKPLDFEHDNITDPNGVVVLRPRVANLTRNILIRSENIGGTRGHTADIGRKASWDIRYNLLVGLGRTQRVPLDDTVPGRHIGTNQRGKYAEHKHHVQSALGSADVGNVYVGPSGGKWGLVIHQTSDALIERNIAVDFPGAGFITEDGYEVRNTFRNNLSAYNLGHDGTPQASFIDSGQEVVRECPGCEGTGFWLRGVMNSFEGNEAWNNFTSGINLFNQLQPPGKYPSTPAGEPDTPLKHFADQPISMTGNVAAANGINGFEMWGVKRFPHKNLTAAHNRYRQIIANSSEGVEPYLQNPKVICSIGTGSIGIHSANGYVTSFTLEQGQVAGCTTGITGGGSGSGMNVTGTILQNEVNVDLVVAPATFTNVMHLPLAQYPHRFILFGNGTVWNGTGPLPDVGGSWYSRQRGSQFIVKNWQGTGKDYRLFYRQSLSSNPAWYSAPGAHLVNTPVQGLTMEQSWDRFGMAFGGDVLEEREAVQLDGIVNGLAREGLGVKLGPPRAIVTFPTMRETARVEGGSVSIFALLTGDPDAASDIMMASVDGERAFPVEAPRGDIRSFPTNHSAAGVHEVKVWRTQKAHPNDAIPGSEYTSKYCVGPCPTIPHGRIGLSLTTAALATDPPGAAPVSKAVTLSNSGSAVLNWNARTDQQWCRLSQYNGRLSVSGSATFTIVADAPPKVGASICTVTVSDTNADNSPQTMTITYSGS
jgi:hypothetical protein